MAVSKCGSMNEDIALCPGSSQTSAALCAPNQVGEGPGGQRAVEQRGLGQPC